MKTFKEWLKYREDFKSYFGGEKNKWQIISAKEIEEDPSIAEDLFKLIDSAYSKIGGHVDLRSPQDIIRVLKSGEMNYFKAIDVDAEPDPDSLVGYKNRHGNKAVVSAAKGTSNQAKIALLNHKIDAHKNKGNYSEISDAAAAVLLKTGIPVIEDELIVRKVLGKAIEWLGEFPDFEVERMRASGIKESTIETFKKHKGWYMRQLGDGKPHVKIMVGIPDITV